MGSVLGLGLDEGGRRMSEICRIADDKNLVILPQDKGEPPLWYPAFAGVVGVYVPRDVFDKLKKLRYSKPCGYCPDEVKKECRIQTR